jgi:hypothetical protein
LDRSPRVLKRGDDPTAVPPPSPFYMNAATPSPTTAAAMSSSLSAQGNP